MAVTETLGTASELTAAGIAADNLVVALYFGLLFALARNLPPEEEAAEAVRLSSFGVLGGLGVFVVMLFVCCVVCVCVQTCEPDRFPSCQSQFCHGQEGAASSSRGPRGEPWGAPSSKSNTNPALSRQPPASPALGYLQALSVSSGLCLLGTWISASLFKGAISSLPVISLLAVRW